MTLLALAKSVIAGLIRHELLMRSCFNNMALIHYADFIDSFNTGQAVCNHQYRFLSSDPKKKLHNQMFGLGI